MIPTIKYDYTEFVTIIENIKNNGVNASYLNELKMELNSFFKDSVCRELVYTENTDKPFFGIEVMPAINGEDAMDIVYGSDPYRIDKYYVELDSKLFSEFIGLTSNEILALLIHEVSALVNDTRPVDEIRKALDIYMERTNENIKVSDSIHYREILAFGIKDSLRKVISAFEKKSDETIANEFMVATGLAQEYEQAFKKFNNSGYNINRNVDERLIVLSWTLRLYKDVKNRRIAAIKLLNKSKDLTASRLEKREMENVIMRLNRIDDDALLESAIESIKNKFNETFKQIKYKGIRSLEDDLYEYNIRLKTVEDEEDALYLLRQINSRIAIIDDYVSTESLGEYERNRWFDLLNKYVKVREELSKKAITRSKYAGIYVTYPEIKSNNY